MTDPNERDHEIARAVLLAVARLLAEYRAEIESRIANAGETDDDDDDG